MRSRAPQLEFEGVKSQTPSIGVRRCEIQGLPQLEFGGAKSQAPRKL
eukprot:gene15556-22214_t